MTDRQAGRRLSQPASSPRLSTAVTHQVTNFHVVRGASDVQVTLFDKRSYSARVVGADADKDVAVLQLDAPNDVVAALQPVSLGSSSGLLVGQRVYAIGNPVRAAAALLCRCVCVCVF